MCLKRASIISYPIRSYVKTIFWGRLFQIGYRPPFHPVQLLNYSFAFLRWYAEMGTRAAARTVAKPFRLTKVPPFDGGAGQFGAAGW